MTGARTRLVQNIRVCFWRYGIAIDYSFVKNIFYVVLAPWTLCVMSNFIHSFIRTVLFCKKKLSALKWSILTSICFFLVIIRVSFLTTNESFTEFSFTSFFPKPRREDQSSANTFFVYSVQFLLFDISHTYTTQTQTPERSHKPRCILLFIYTYTSSTNLAHFF